MKLSRRISFSVWHRIGNFGAKIQIFFSWNRVGKWSILVCFQSISFARFLAQRQNFAQKWIYFHNFFLFVKSGQSRLLRSVLLLLSISCFRIVFCCFVKWAKDMSFFTVDSTKKKLGWYSKPLCCWVKLRSKVMTLTDKVLLRRIAYCFLIS